MKKQSIKFALLFITPLCCASCSLLLDETYAGNAYNSPVFAENYYKTWDERIDEQSDKYIVSSETQVTLDESEDKVFTSYYSLGSTQTVSSNLYLLDSQTSSLKYSDDNSTGLDDSNLYGVAYGETRKMSRIDDSFRYGYLSKLFDGQMFCEGRYQLARVQIDTQGFGHMFSKELKDYTASTYFALNFKAAVDYTNPETPASTHTSDIDLHISFYTRNTDNSLNKQTATYRIESIPTNASESHSSSCYTFFGFSLAKFNISRLCGISIEYTLLRDEYAENYGLDYSLMLYEMMIPFTTWY